MKTWVLSIPLLFSHFLAAEMTLDRSDERMNFPQTMIEEGDDQALFYWIQANVNNLRTCATSNDAANELRNLIEEGYKIDTFNMLKLIENLTFINASDNAKNVIVKAIEYHSAITPDHLFCLIQTLAEANAANHATEIILVAIEQGIKLGPRERFYLAEMSRIASARKHVEKIRKALHERANQT